MYARLATCECKSEWHRILPWKRGTLSQWHLDRRTRCQRRWRRPGRLRHVWRSCRLRASRGNTSGSNRHQRCAASLPKISKEPHAIGGGPEGKFLSTSPGWVQTCDPRLKEGACLWLIRLSAYVKRALGPAVQALLPSASGTRTAVHC